MISKEFSRGGSKTLALLAEKKMCKAIEQGGSSCLRVLRSGSCVISLRGLLSYSIDMGMKCLEEYLTVSRCLICASCC